MRKKMLLILLSVCLMVTCFAACGDKDDDKANATATPSATIAATAAAEATPTAVPTATPDNSADDAIIFRFDSEEDFENGEGAYENIFEAFVMIRDPENLKVTNEDGLIIPVEGFDPYFSYKDFESFDLSEYHYMKVCMKNQTPGHVFEIFLVENGATIAGDHAYYNDISANDTEFKTYLFDIAKKAKPSYLDREISLLRLDLVGDLTADGITEDTQICLKYIAFFKTEEAAQAYK